MKIKQYMSEKADKIGAIASSVTGAGMLGQFPQYLAQYAQRIGGHIDEARIIAQSEAMPKLLERAETLEAGLEKIMSAGALEKIVAFARHAEWSIAKRAYEAFTPGMTFDSEGITYAAIGTGLGYLAYEGVKAGIKSLRKKGDKK